MTDLVAGRASSEVAAPERPSKSGRIGWVGKLNQALAEGLADSQWLASLEADQMAAGKQICLDLWPFIVGLPDNIKAVKDKLPDTLEPAKLFLNNLADEERHYQALYIKQCELAGLSYADLMTSTTSPTAETAGLLRAMKEACADSQVLHGVEAIVTAELAATRFARVASPAFEIYFTQHAAQYAPERIEEGLAWLRLHAKTNTRHALWLNRMLTGLSQEAENADLPPTALHILESIFSLWRVDKDIVRFWLSADGKNGTNNQI